MKDFSLYEDVEMPDKDFPIRVFLCELNALSNAANHFEPHWHEEIELLYFLEGEAQIACNAALISVKPGDLVVVNSNDLHAGYASGDKVLYYCIIIDLSLLRSNYADVCELKYIHPISQNLILFCNKIASDREICRAVREICVEYRERAPAFELAIKSYIYYVLTVLFRNYVARVLTEKEYQKRVKGLERLKPVLDYISQNFIQKLSVGEAAALAKMSPYYFCHLFKAVTGKTLGDYINFQRIKRAELLLRTTAMNITEIALCSGFDDINYFSRIFKKYKRLSPSELRRSVKMEIPLMG